MHRNETKKNFAREVEEASEIVQHLLLPISGAQLLLQVLKRNTSIQGRQHLLILHTVAVALLGLPMPREQEEDVG